MWTTSSIPRSQSLARGEEPRPGYPQRRARHDYRRHVETQHSKETMRLHFSRSLCGPQRGSARSLFTTSFFPPEIPEIPEIPLPLDDFANAPGGTEAGHAAAVAVEWPVVAFSPLVPGLSFDADEAGMKRSEGHRIDLRFTQCQDLGEAVTKKMSRVPARECKVIPQTRRCARRRRHDPRPRRCE